MAHPKRFELLTPRFVVWCSIQLSYGCLPFCDRRVVCGVRDGFYGFRIWNARDFAKFFVIFPKQM